ncbi:unnamed protein product [Darwinula stevensoni]|uniref:C-type lectin domain-containing protein n=1 Tax=Darwinula stevensoni TaxID=69355 RepID=A0A7R8X6D5_9CRUS|nr:unnamed protein product [Darwinula stevensoni]CAG0885649.1 unnamed protein product [Darwinula stevensoni]
MQNSTCLSYSVTQGSTSVTCLLGKRFDEPRTAEAFSKFFYADMPIPAGYNLVAGTRSYVKMTLKTITGNAAETACKQDHAELVSSSNEAVYNYTKQLWKNQASSLNILVGGQSSLSAYYVAFPDAYIMNCGWVHNLLKEELTNALTSLELDTSRCLRNALKFPK